MAITATIAAPASALVLPRIFSESLYQDPKKPHRHRLTRPHEITLSTGEFLVIPEGFITDFASVPRLLWGVVSPSGRHNAAALIHDYLYINKHHRGRLFADLEFLRWLRASRVSEIKALSMFCAVRIGGRKWWNKTK